MEELSRVEKRKRQDKRKKGKKFTWKKVFFSTIVLVVFFFLFLGAGFKLADTVFEHFGNSSIPSSQDDEDDEDIKENRKLNKGPINILIVGTDQRKNEAARSDTMILAVLFPEKEEVRLLSIPRDTRVRIPGRKNLEKITHAHAYGDIELAKETAEDFLGLDMDYYVKTNFRGFSNIIDILGGIELDVERRMYRPTEDINLKPGKQTLNGRDALAYVRFRDDGRGDIGRVERQAKFSKAVADEVKSISTVWKLPKLFKEVNDNIDTDMKITDMIYLAGKFSSIDSEKIITTMVPGDGDYIGGVSYYIADEKELKELLKKYEDSAPYISKEEEKALAEKAKAEKEAKEKEKEKKAQESKDKEQKKSKN